MDWKKIETAPHDEQILLHTPSGDMHVGVWVQNIETGDEAFVIADLGSAGRAIVRPDYWMQLPSGPNT